MGFRKLYLSGLLCALIAVAVPPSHAGGPRRPELGSRGPGLKPAGRITEVEILRPAAASKVRHPLMVLRLDDGRRVVVTAPSVRSKQTRAKEPISVSWTIDLEAGTYVAEASPLTERDRLLLKRSPKAAPFKFDEEVGQTGRGYSYVLAGETWEPGAYIGFPGLTRTVVQIGWSECANGVLYRDAFATSCWANPLTFVNTTWLKVACDPDPPPASGGGWLEGSVEGVYLNWDFWDDNLPTWVHEEPVIAVSSGGVVIPNIFRDFEGEFSWLLSGRDFEGPLTSEPDSCSSHGSGGSGDFGGSDGSTTPIGGEDGCVDVYDGVSGEMLGQCCVATIADLIVCAAGYL